MGDVNGDKVFNNADVDALRGTLTLMDVSLMIKAVQAADQPVP